MAKQTPSLIIGDYYGDWCILEHKPRPKENYYLVRCKCGLEKEVSKSNLTLGKSKSCNKGSCKSTSLTHGLSNTKLYGVWRNILSRAKNPTGANKCYAGVSVCTNWKYFQNFADWAVANGYSEGLSIDRIDRNGNYEPTNCRWTNAVVQSQNRSKQGGKILPKGIYMAKPRNSVQKYTGTGKAPYYWVVIYKGDRHQKWGFETPEEAYGSRKQFIEANYKGLVYLD